MQTTNKALAALELRLLWAERLAVGTAIHAEARNGQDVVTLCEYYAQPAFPKAKAKKGAVVVRTCQPKQRFWCKFGIARGPSKLCAIAPDEHRRVAVTIADKALNILDGRAQLGVNVHEGWKENKLLLLSLKWNISSNSRGPLKISPKPMKPSPKSLREKFPIMCIPRALQRAYTSWWLMGTRPPNSSKPKLAAVMIALVSSL